MCRWYRVSAVCNVRYLVYVVCNPSSSRDIVWCSDAKVRNCRRYCLCWLCWGEGFIKMQTKAHMYWALTSRSHCPPYPLKCFRHRFYNLYETWDKALEALLTSHYKFRTNCITFDSRDWYVRSLCTDSDIPNNCQFGPKLNVMQLSICGITSGALLIIKLLFQSSSNWKDELSFNCFADK